MISKKTLKGYEFKTMYDYFDYIEESRINGLKPQVKDLIKDLSNNQFKSFLNYLKEYENDEQIYIYTLIRCSV